MKMRTWFAFTLGAAMGAGASYLLDPDKGDQRRAEARDLAVTRAKEMDLDTQAQFYANKAKGALIERSKQLRSQERTYDPKTLIRKVESEVVGHSSVESGQVVVDADDQGVVTLRGQIPSQHLIDELVRETEQVEGVKAVNNRMHLPTQPAPSQASAPSS